MPEQPLVSNEEYVKEVQRIGKDNIEDWLYGNSDTMSLIARLFNHLGIDNIETNRNQFLVMLEAMLVYQDRNSRFPDNWKHRGWIGNIFHMDHKVSRLMNEFWLGQGAVERKPDDDDAVDLINYTIFFIRNLRAGNERG